MNLVRINLAKIRMFAHHGIYREERVVGAEFEVSMDVGFETAGIITSLEDTVNYVKLHDIIRTEMSNPRPLLETVGMEIADRVKALFPHIREINITISKINPPLANFRGELGISVVRRY